MSKFPIAYTLCIKEVVHTLVVIIVCLYNNIRYIDTDNISDNPTLEDKSPIFRGSLIPDLEQVTSTNKYALQATMSYNTHITRHQVLKEHVHKST